MKYILIITLFVASLLSKDNMKSISIYTDTIECKKIKENTIEDKSHWEQGA